MIKRIHSSFLLVFLLFTSIHFAQTFNEQEVKNYLAEKEKIFEDISVQMGIANWNVYSEEGEADQDTPKQRYYELFNNSELKENIDKWFVESERLTDKVLKRRIEMWHNILTGAKVDMNEKIFKLENELEAKLTADESGNEKNDAAVLNLMKLRNEKAKEAGFNNYAEMMIELTDIGMDNLNSFYAEMIKRTDEPYQKLLDEIGHEDITMNDIRRLFGMFYRNSGLSGIEKEKQLDVMKETLANIGFNFDELPIRFVEKINPYGGNALAIHIPDDMRIIMNVNMPLGVWMHEIGHGLHGVFTSVESPILKGYEWNVGGQCPAFGEGMAEVGAGFVSNREWQKKYINATDEELNEKFEQLKKYFPAYLRYWFTTVMFEVEFYKDLSQDPKELKNKICKDLLKVDGADQPVSLSGDIMMVSYPVYYQNYLFASIVALQVHKTLEEKFGKDYMFNKEVGPWLVKNLYTDGEATFWKDKLKAATGKEFDVNGFFSYYGL